VYLSQKRSLFYDILDTYAMRTPLLSMDFCRKYMSKEVLAEKDFKEIAKHSFLREGIYLASPQLHAQILKWEQGSLKDPLKIERLKYAILKYAMRVATRCTPFGLFASCSTGSFGATSRVNLLDPRNFERYTRLDTTFLSRLSIILQEDEVILSELLFYPNSSLYEISDHYRYVEYRINNKKRQYSLEGITRTESLEIILAAAKNGKTIKELSILLVDEDITLQDGVAFINQLIQLQLLVSELEITVTGKDYFTHVIERLSKIPDSEETYLKLTELQMELNSLDHTIGNSIRNYKIPIHIAREVVPKLDVKYLFQTDCFSKTTTNSLNIRVKKQLQKVFNLFNKLTVANTSRNLADFKTNFVKRFQQSEVPLHLALDAETGIGYGTKKEDSNSILDGFSLGNTTPKRYEHITWTDVDAILHKKLTATTQRGDYILALSDDDFKDLPLDVTDLPDTMSSIIEVYNDDHIFIYGASGSSAVNLLGRFSHGDSNLMDHVNNIIGIEENNNKDMILAEIVHLPEARTGNILQRPHLRSYEIPYLGKSSLPAEFQISIDDLLVSVQNETVILRSKKLNKRILPRMGNAHNYSNSSLPIYQFLCELQSDNKRSWIGFQWNSIHKAQTFLPRVTYGTTIISKARWNVETSVFKKIVEQKRNLNAFSTWQSSLQLPDDVELVEGDNKLLINFKNKTSVNMLLHTVKNSKHFILEEFLFDQPGIVKDDNGRVYCNQFVISHYKTI
jgi:hypothetical protein